jgi:hypothetical protein
LHSDFVEEGLRAKVFDNAYWDENTGILGDEIVSPGPLKSLEKGFL